MSDQLALDFTPPRLSDPAENAEGARHRRPRPTEREAALAVWPRTGTQRLAVLEAIAAAGEHGLTDTEIAERTGLYLYSAAPRRVELVKGGWVEDAGEVRATGRGGSAAAWRLTPAAKAHRAGSGGGA